MFLWHVESEPICRLKSFVLCFIESSRLIYKGFAEFEVTNFFNKSNRAHLYLSLVYSIDPSKNIQTIAP